MAEVGSESTSRRASLIAALSQAVKLELEWAVPLFVANLVLAGLVVAYLLLLVGIPVLIVALPVLALPMASLTRLAIVAVRSGVPTLAMARDEFGRQPLRKLALAAVHLLIVGVALANVGLAGRIGGVLAVLSGGVAIWAIAVTVVYAVAAWPIICDPRRAGPVGDQLRLALAVTVRRPLQLAVLAAIATLAAVISIQLVLFALFLPSVVLLAIAGYVVSVADEILPPIT